MLKLWGRTSSINVQKALITLKELKLDFEYIHAGGQYGVVDTPEFGALNPNRTVPVLQDGDFVLWESNAIVRYLAYQYGKGSVAPESLKPYSQADSWMDWTSILWWPSIAPAFIGLIRTPEDKRDNAAIEAALKRSLNCAKVLDQTLAAKGSAYLGGEQPSMADIALVCSAHRWLALASEADRASVPALTAWYGRFMKRDSVKDVLTLPLS